MLRNENPEPKRARRIRAVERAKAHARWVAKHIWAQNPEWQKRAEKIADHLAHCRKPCCNNRRRYEGPTIQELRQWASEQKPLDREFAKVLYDNLWDMYVRS